MLQTVDDGYRTIYIDNFAGLKHEWDAVVSILHVIKLYMYWNIYHCKRVARWDTKSIDI